MSYVELRAHTAFSFGDGSVTPEALVQRARRLGYTALGITDTADLGAVVRFVGEATQPVRDPRCPRSDTTRGPSPVVPPAPRSPFPVPSHSDLGSTPCPVCQRSIRPIIGGLFDIDGHPAALLAQTATGYRNLAGLVTLARVGHWRSWDKTAQHGRRGRPGLTWDQLASRTAGLFALTGPASGDSASRLRAGDDDGASQALVRWRDLFGERLAVEVQLHHTGGEEAALAGALIALAERSGVMWTVAHAPRYINDRSRLVHDLLTAIRHDMDVAAAAERGLLHPNGEWRLLSPAAMTLRWAGREEGIRASERIAESCAFDLRWMRPPLPDFRVPAGHDLATFLRERTYEGARHRWGDTLSDEQRRQLEHELDLIIRLDFAGFFLVMWDAARFAREEKILCQGRGSAANSAVAYCLGITAVDPVLHGLLFERFLSDIRAEGGADAPDIDVDFEHHRREEALDYVYDRYGRARAAITATVQTYRAPNAVQDAMRGLGYPADLADDISKRVHRLEPEEGAERVESVVAGRCTLDLSDARGRALLSAIKGFEGLPRLRSTHVGGFVLSRAPLGDYLPIEQTAMGRTILQFDKDDLDAIGVPKFDFLGLGALSAVRRAFDVIEQRTGERPEMYSLPQNDRATYGLISRGETIGTFQIESRAQIGSILLTHPETLYDIVVQVALIRPGPIQAKFVRPYTERRRGREPVQYLHPALEPILKRTQGIPIFQEQAMAIAMVLGGYSGGEADVLRRSMGNIRKIGRLKGALEQLKDAMIRRGREGVMPGLTEEIAAKLCEDLVSFANYGFPESHAWSFALIAYATAYLKAHHPAEFFCGLFNSLPMGFYSIGTLIHDARRHEVPLLPACLRRGRWECTVEDSDDRARPALRIGWQHIRGIGSKVLDALKAAHDAAPFRSIADVVQRARLTREQALALAQADSFAAWTSDRRQAAWEALRVLGDCLPLAPAGEWSTYEPPPLDQRKTIFLDYNATGLSLSGHPMEIARPLLRGMGVNSEQLQRVRHGRTIAVAGLVTVRQRPSTANGTIFLLLEDEHGFINVVVPSVLVEPNEEVVKYAQFIVVQGHVERNGGAINVVGRKFKALEVEAIGHISHDFH